uniref:Uncharacterized protein n=1 Tax=viral metagenome TaxID=1070528 RepID=A0A6M3JUY1_9ZZZZ
MPFDSELILRGQYEGAYVDLDTNDVAPTSLTVNDDGNVCIDLGNPGTDGRGLDCFLQFHDVCTTYQDTLTAQICDSDHLLDGWHTLMVFPIIYCYMREVIVTATTAFVGTDLDLVFTATTGTDTGVLREFSRELLTVGGIGKCWIEMQDAGDTYATLGDIVTCTAGTGVGTITKIGRVIEPWKQMVRRFSTYKRYIRPTLTVSATGNYGDVDMFVTDRQHQFPNRLLMTGGV